MARPLLAGLLPLLLIAGCSSTPLGQQLGASFDAPPAAEPQPAAKLEPTIKPVPAAQPQAEPTSEDATTAPEPDQQPEAVAEPTTAKQPEAKAEPALSGEPRDPQPYRVILRLPSADPSAPAEAVTKALRAAGLPFEVETIERLQPAKQP